MWIGMASSTMDVWEIANTCKSKLYLATYFI